jgi:hypothetical protein
LQEVLPIGQELSTTAIRQRVSQTAQRLDDELGEEQDMFIGGRQRDWDRLPDPAAPLIVGIDGGYVHAKDQQSRAEGWFEVIVGKSMSQDGESSKCFGFVNRYDTKPKRRLFEMLKSQGMQMNQAVTFLSDGGDTVRDLQLYLNPQAEHLLDWFHISMRLTVMSQLAKSIEADDQPNLSAEIEKDLKRLKWNLWHGNVHKALQIVKDLEYALDLEENSQEQRKLLKAVREFGIYITANRTFIPNYGDRYRHGETISTAFVESAINQVVSKRMVKKQQMRWTDRGAHLLLQVRTRVLNEEWRSTLSHQQCRRHAMRRRHSPRFFPVSNMRLSSATITLLIEPGNSPGPRAHASSSSPSIRSLGRVTQARRQRTDSGLFLWTRIPFQAPNCLPKWRRKFKVIDVLAAARRLNWINLLAGHLGQSGFGII